MKFFSKTLLLLYSIISIVSASEIQYYEFNPLNYEGNEDKYDVILPKIESDDGAGNIVYEKVPQQATTNDGNNTPVFTDTNCNATTTKTNYKVLVQNNIVIPSWNPKYSDNISLFEFDNNNMPVVVKSLKSDFITPYIRNGQAVFRQKIKKQYNEYGNNNNYSDVNLQFDESGNPKFVVENGAEKQAIDTDRNPNMPWVSVYDANDGATLHYGTTIRIQKPTSQSYNLAYDPSGIPYVTQVRKQDSTLYTENNIAVFRQTFENDSDVELEFDALGNPIFIKEANNMFRYATTTNGNSAFVVSGTNSDFNEEYIYVSDQVQPVLIQ